MCPVVMGNKIVGVYQKHNDTIIPTPEIKHFLNGIGERRPIGFGSLDIWHQDMVDAQLRRHFRMSHDTTGVLITKIDPLSNALKVLKKHDVILAIEGIPVNNDGTVHFQKKEWLGLDELVSMKKPGETALVKILRDGKEQAFNVSLNFTTQRLVPYKFLPSYYILGGFVFMALSEPCIDRSRKDICDCALYRMATKAGEQIVIISQVLLDDINKEYSKFTNFEVKKVNGVEVVNLKHLSELIENCCTEDLRFDLEKGNVIVLNKKSAKEATSVTLERYGIPSAMSDDLQ
ncbi:unnamed protein product [Thlaspi arvense]|uniref:Protease Do-like PDZ domain-containing protein n=1 Tax=Thlaspi arvense TaxID=13288 RepID=A0AAU9RJR5_THLAR|nr:unnamed protein product [Thlaspi arvense]